MGLGAVLMQDERHIAFYSKKLSTIARTKSVYERELMAIVFAIKKWSPYILGKHFVVQTDQCSLRFLLEQRVVEAEYQKWLIKLMPYNFRILLQAWMLKFSSRFLITNTRRGLLISTEPQFNFRGVKENGRCRPFFI